MLVEKQAKDTTTVVHAQWVVPDKYYPYTCSNCFYEFVSDDDDTHAPERCPNCGAVMDSSIQYLYI